MTVMPNVVVSNSPPLFLSNAATAANETEIDLVIPQQLLDNWCWAAVTMGLEAAFAVQPVRSQCRIVTDVLGTGTCCPEGADVVRCNVPHAPQPALRGLFRERVDAPEGTSFSFVRDEIVDRRLPVLANLGFRSGRVGHLVVISGFRRVGSAVMLIVWDPYTGQRSDEPLRQFQQAFRDKGTWRASYRLQRAMPVTPH
jgi:hypothetical protein